MHAMYNHLHYLLDLHAYTHAQADEDSPDVAGARDRAECWRRKMTAGQRVFAERINALLIEAREEEGNIDETTVTGQHHSPQP